MSSILFCAPTAYTGGGVEEWLYALSRGLRRHGWDVQVALAAGARFHRPLQYLERYPYKDPHIVFAPLGLREERYLALRKLFAQTKPDIIVPVQLGDALYAAVRHKREAGVDPCRIASCLHGHFADIIGDFNRCRADLDLIVSVSRAGALCLMNEHAWADDHVLHIPSGVPRPIAEQSRLSGPFCVGYVGRLEQNEKRIMDLPSLVKQCFGHGDMVFHIVGSGPDEKAVRDQLEAEVNAGRVVFHGALTRRKLYSEIYPCLHSLVIFSEAEGGPIVAWEAMAHGVVPVVSDFVGRAEEGVLIDQQNCRVFPVGAVDQAAEALLEIKVKPVWHRLSNCATKLPDAYRLEAFSAGWDRALRKLLTQTSHRGSSPCPRMVSPGRLPQWCDEKMALCLRKPLRRRHAASNPGDEWPHAYGGNI